MKNFTGALLASLLLLGAGSAQAQTDTTAVRAPYRTDAAPADTPCVRQVRRIAPPPSPRRFRRQWPMAAAGSILGWLIADRAVGPTGSPYAILSASTLGSMVGSHLQAAGEGHPNLARSVGGSVLGALPAGALLYMNQADTHGEREILTRGLVPAVGGALQGAVTAAATSSSLQPARIQIIECPQLLVPGGS
jgi:hypothetical protein